ncbi:cytochrome P450, partial [Priestia sp. SIMBA_032]
PGAPRGSALDVVSAYTEPDSRGAMATLPPQVAAVELLNLLRPTVAVGRYLTFAALALHRHPGWRDDLAAGNDVAAHWFAQEVR